MPRGRPPVPKAINDLRGDPGKRRRKQQEPEPPSGHPECPDYLDDLAKQEWSDTCSLLDSMGLLSKADKTALELYCSAYSRYRKAEEMVRRVGEVYKAPSGYIGVSPYVTCMNRNLDTCRKFLAEFGLTPVSRSRLTTTDTSVQDELDSFLRITA